MSHARRYRADGRRRSSELDNPSLKLRTIGDIVPTAAQMIKMALVTPVDIALTAAAAAANSMTYLSEMHLFWRRVIII